MILTVEKKIRGGLYDSIYRYEKHIINTWKILIKIKNRYSFKIGMHIICTVVQCHKSLH